MEDTKSLALLAANQRLYELRAKRAGPEGAQLKERPVETGGGQLLDAGWALRNGQALLQAYRQRDGVDGADAPTAAHADTLPRASESPAMREDVDPTGSLPAGPAMQTDGAPTIRHYPTLGTAALQAGEAPCYRLWLACHALDPTGRGWLSTETVQQRLAGEESDLRLCGRRRLRQLLRQGEGRFWHEDDQGRLWLAGMARLTAVLGVDRLAGRPVELPLAALTGGVGVFRAHLYAAWHSGRKLANPISRETQEALIGVPARTQRHYGQVAGVSSKRNLAVGDRYDEEVMEQRAWQRGRAVFEFVDVQGRQGPKNRHYVAWRLPNSYQGPHRQATRGRQRKVNRRLKDLVNKRAQGNGSQKVDKLFYRDGAEAGRVFNRRSGSEAYWPALELPAGQVVWGVFLRR
ncbi:MAG: hypothetical protein L0332_24415 [Chloroflexi bacterium]|nr:hypothetical protein [Chloroflexota bacterium]MCI0649927.1 hypothetical protein [Chloroflexota bacterium]MCI0729840.1 hypothetical protein [Chloroflexota bacterium]